MPKGAGTHARSRSSASVVIKRSSRENDHEAARRDEIGQLRRLELVSFMEGTTLLLLVCAAVPLKHVASIEDAVHVMGPVHGMAFLAYMWTAIQTVSGGGWSRGETARLLAGAVVPFGGFLNLRFLARRAAALA